ncbi:MAG TPA: hypothetical protein VGO00_00265 [Kofleriaceae bacterium]|jgi:hypothetical protein|nr:hypothetical protein [Kofleriaceae bacterium]
MRAKWITIVLVALTSVAAADGERAADKGSFGVGIMIGEPVGLTAKLYLRDDRAIQAGLGSAFIGGGFQGDADYLFHPYILQDRDSFTMPLYFGPGVRIVQYDNGRDSSYVALGLRAVGGMLFDFKNVPLDTFIELAIIPEFGFGSNHGFALRLNADAGIRYYF